MASESLRTGEQFDGYEIVDRISEGGMGTIYLVRRSGLPGVVKYAALKTLRSELAGNERHIAGFLDEARLVASLQHPGIAQVYDCGVVDEIPYVVMEYVSGLTVSELLAQPEPVPIKAVVELIAQAARALHHAHGALSPEGEWLEIIHRDISPQNIMLDANGVVKVIDFGIAWTAQRVAPNTMTGQVKGKPSYMAPEQIAGMPLDGRADLFSLGVVLYELLTRTPLFTRPTIAATMWAVMNMEPPPLEVTRSGIPASLEAALRRALAKDRDLRFHTGEDFAVALEATLLELSDGGVATYATTLPFRDFTSTQSPQVVEAPKNLFAADTVDIANAPAVKRPMRRGLAFTVGGAALGLAFGLYAFVPADESSAPVLPSPETEPIEELSVAVADETVETAEAPAAPPVPVKKPKALPGPRRKPRKLRREKPAAAQAAPVAGSGFLTVRARPYAIVRINQKNRGVTPLNKIALPVGTHELVLLDPETDAVRTRRDITIKAGEVHRVMIK